MSSASDLVSWALNEPTVSDDQRVFVDAANPSRQLTKSNIRVLVQQFIGGFVHANQNQYLQGDVVCVDSFNDVDRNLIGQILYPVLFLSVIGAGGCFTGTNPAYTVPELTHHCLLSKAKFIITEAERLERVRAAATQCGIPESHIFLLHEDDASNTSGLKPWTELLSHGEKPWVALDEEGARKTPAALLSTSGTTGLPKLAARSHRGFIQEGIAMKDSSNKSYRESRLVSIPLFHAFAAPLCLTSALRYGITTHIMRRFSEQEFLDCIESNKITETAVVPPLIVKFLSGPVDQKRKQLSSLRLILCAGAHLDASIQERANKELLDPEARIAQVWGMTECGWISTFFHPEKDETGSVGRPMPGYQCRIVNDEGQVLSDSQAQGEICVKSPAMMMGYLENPKATAETIDRENWVHTGDIGHIRDGKVYLVDRKKELIKVRGWQVSPAEIESTLVKHEVIADAAVVGVVDEAEIGAEIPHAYVVCKQDAYLSEKEVKQHLFRYLARYKVADCKVFFCNEVPRSPSGKILRRLLRPSAAPAMKRRKSIVGTLVSAGGSILGRALSGVLRYCESLIEHTMILIRKR